MVSSVNAYQQQIQIQQQSTTTPTRRETTETRERERDETVVSRSRTDDISSSRENERTEQDRKTDALRVVSDNTASQGRDTAQRRGSVLDITA